MTMTMHTITVAIWATTEVAEAIAADMVDDLSGPQEVYEGLDPSFTTVTLLPVAFDSEGYMAAREAERDPHGLAALDRATWGTA